MSNINSNINPENTYEKVFCYENYFKGIKPLKDYFSDKELKISSNIRVFQSKEKDSGYEEIFLNEDSETFAGISNHISFLYPPKIRGYQNRIGFRYYKEEPLISKKNIPYFTLVRIGVTKFKILEKESDIKDNNGASFKIDDLDCLDIMLTIIKEKIKKDEDHLLYPNSTSELLGFIYACKYCENKINNIEILHPFIPSPFSTGTLCEAKKVLDTTKYFLEPIMCNNHISLLFFYYKENWKDFYVRKNIIFDMSSVHYKGLLKLDPIFDEEMTYNIIKFPNNSIQMGSSCSMWFYSSLLFLLRYKIELPFNTSALYQIIEIIYDLLNFKEEDIKRNKITNREFENIDCCSFISYKLALKPFIDIDSILEELNWNKNTGPGGLGEYQKIFLEAKNNVNLLKINIKYYKKVYNIEIISIPQLNNVKSSIAKLENLFYLIIEAKKNKFLIITSNEKEHPNLSDLNKNIENSIIDFTSLSKEIKSKISAINKKYPFYSTHKIHELYFDNRDIFLNIMDD